MDAAGGSGAEFVAAGGGLAFGADPSRLVLVQRSEQVGSTVDRAPSASRGAEGGGEVGDRGVGEDLLAVPDQQQGADRVLGRGVGQVLVCASGDGVVGGPQVVPGHEQIKVELGGQAEQLAAAVIVDAGERLVQGQQAGARGARGGEQHVRGREQGK